MRKYLAVVSLLLLAFLIGCAGKTDDSAAKANPQLTVNAIGAGLGTIMSSPAGISCGQDCDHRYTKGVTITLTVTPDKDSTFEGWSGDCSGEASCSIAIDSAKAVTAKFGANPLNFNLPNNLPAATVGVQYEYSFYNTNPQGGKGPHSFVLATGIGFPPFGLTVNVDGVLRGKPTTEEQRHFGICLVDFSGYQKCKETNLAVNKEEIGEGITGSWEGPYDLSVDISFFCSNLPILTHEGKIKATLKQDGENITGTATLNGIKSISIDGYGKCTPTEGPEFTGDVGGEIIDGEVTLTINFGDPDLFMNELTISGQLKDGEISGDITGVDGAGGVTLIKQD